MSVLVSHGGDLVLERYFQKDAAKAHNIASVTKSVVSTLVGIAVDDGLLSLDDTLGRLLPSYAFSMSADVAGLRLEQLLTMTAGFPDDVSLNGVGFDPLAPDWVRDILRRGQTGPVGHFAYSSATSHLLAAILEQVTGRPLAEYAEERLLAPLGVDTSGMTQPVLDPSTVRAYQRDPRSFLAYQRAPVSWPVDPQGVTIGLGFLKLRPRDLVGFGRLFLDRGRWRGRQVVSAEWVDRATSDQLEVRESDSTFGYGFQWWIGDLGGAPAAIAMGLGGQLVVVAPQLDLVVVATSRITEPPALAPDDLLGLLDDSLLGRA
jgi:CubicO group peptidase (beta-lactamase class C family)